MNINVTHASEPQMCAFVCVPTLHSPKTRVQDSLKRAAVITETHHNNISPRAISKHYTKPFITKLHQHTNSWKLSNNEMVLLFYRS